MGIRRKARESALQMLYQLDMSGQDLNDAMASSGALANLDAEVRQFAQQLVNGVVGDLAEIDKLIAAHSTNWKISRMAAVDKNILRMAVYELKNFSDIPIKVTINEAVEIAKRFGSGESGAFVNGILDNIAQDFKKDKGEPGELDD
ncbi:MAG: transcription antitermination factor NusB [Pseudomonadota bacterium]